MTRATTTFEYQRDPRSSMSADEVQVAASHLAGILVEHRIQALRCDIASDAWEEVCRRVRLAGGKELVVADGLGVSVSADVSVTPALIHDALVFAVFRHLTSYRLELPAYQGQLSPMEADMLHQGRMRVKTA